MRYTPRGADLKQETDQLGRVLEAPTFPTMYLEETFAAPARPQEGQLVFADGATWNPGAGRGVYCYHGAAWNLLG